MKKSQGMKISQLFKDTMAKVRALLEANKPVRDGEAARGPYRHGRSAMLSVRGAPLDEPGKCSPPILTLPSHPSPPTNATPRGPEKRCLDHSRGRDDQGQAERPLHDQAGGVLRQPHQEGLYPQEEQVARRHPQLDQGREQPADGVKVALMHRP